MRPKPSGAALLMVAAAVSNRLDRPGRRGAAFPLAVEVAHSLPIPTKPPCAGRSQRDPAGEGPARVVARQSLPTKFRFPDHEMERPKRGLSAFDDIERLDQLGEVGKRPRQPVELVDDDHVDLSRAFASTAPRR